MSCQENPGLGWGFFFPGFRSGARMGWSFLLIRFSSVRRYAVPPAHRLTESSHYAWLLLSPGYHTLQHGAMGSGLAHRWW